MIRKSIVVLTCGYPPLSVALRQAGYIVSSCVHAQEMMDVLKRSEEAPSAVLFTTRIPTGRLEFEKLEIHTLSTGEDFYYKLRKEVSVRMPIVILAENSAQMQGFHRVEDTRLFLYHKDAIHINQVVENLTSVLRPHSRAPVTPR